MVDARPRPAHAALVEFALLRLTGGRCAVLYFFSVEGRQGRQGWLRDVCMYVEWCVACVEVGGEAGEVLGVSREGGREGEGRRGMGGDVPEAMGWGC